MAVDDLETVQCTCCGEDYLRARRTLGFLTCSRCGEDEAREVKHTIVPMHKSNLVVISPGDRDILIGISNKSGQVLGGGGGSNGKTRDFSRGVEVTPPRRVNGSGQTVGHKTGEQSEAQAKQSVRSNRDNAQGARTSVQQGKTKKDKTYPRHRRYYLSDGEGLLLGARFRRIRF